MKSSLNAVGVLAFCALLRRTASYEVVAEWTWLDVEYPNQQEKDDALANGDFVPENLCPVGIKVWDGVTYLTTPRMRSGVPVTLSTMVESGSPGEPPILRPYPSWEMQEALNCEMLQSVQNVEYDPASDQLWIIDIGEVDGIGVCPPKLLIWDVVNNVEVYRYTFPSNVMSQSDNFLNDVAVDPSFADRRFAYFSDNGLGPITGQPGGIIVLDRQSNESWRLEHPSMLPEPEHTTITVQGVDFYVESPINGIALSPDGQTFFYSALSAVTLYSVPTQALRDNSADLTPYVKVAGTKPSPGGGMYYGHSGLYYGSFETAEMIRWDIQQDQQSQGEEDLGDVAKETETVLGQSVEEIVCPDTLHLADDGYLYNTANKIVFFLNDLLTEETAPNFRILRFEAGEDTPYILNP